MRSSSVMKAQIMNFFRILMWWLVLGQARKYCMTIHAASLREASSLGIIFLTWGDRIVSGLSHQQTDEVYQSSISTKELVAANAV